MAKAKTFESFQSEQIPLYKKNNSGVMSTSSKNENDNIKSIIENSEEDV